MAFLKDSWLLPLLPETLLQPLQQLEEELPLVVEAELAVVVEAGLVELVVEVEEEVEQQQEERKVQG